MPERDPSLSAVAETVENTYPEQGRDYSIEYVLTLKAQFRGFLPNIVFS